MELETLPDPEKKKPPMQNITINIPDLFDINIQKLIRLKIVPSRSEAIRIALREYLTKEYQNLELLGWYDEKLKKKEDSEE